MEEALTEGRAWHMVSAVGRPFAMGGVHIGCTSQSSEAGCTAGGVHVSKGRVWSLVGSAPAQVQSVSMLDHAASHEHLPSRGASPLH